MLDDTPNTLPHGHLFPYTGYEPEVTRIVYRFLKPGDCAVDVGANVGYYTVLMSNIVGEGGLVFSFEPCADVFQHLIRNIHLVYKLNNVAVFKTAIWSWDRPELEISAIKGFEGHTSAMVKYDKVTHTEIVEARCLDTLMLDQNHPRLIKIDVEGAELEVLRGAKNILSRGVDCIILELNYDILGFMKRGDREIRDFMHDLGYDMFLINLTSAPGVFTDPFYVEPHRWIEVRQGTYEHRMINVMFSTKEKVEALWSKIGST